MIYIFYGQNFEERNFEIKNKAEGTSIIRLSALNTTRELLLNYAEQNSLFSEVFTVILENPISESDVSFDNEFLDILKKSSSVFIFLEDHLLSEEVKKYKKYAEDVIEFEAKIVVKKENPFVLANLFGDKDKIGTWVTYRKLIERGGGAEPIAGMLFWKVKSMILSGNRNFNEQELKNQSKELIDIYHKSHLGILDMDIALEQFILKHL